MGRPAVWTCNTGQSTSTAIGTLVTAITAPPRPVGNGRWVPSRFFIGLMIASCDAGGAFLTHPAPYFVNVCIGSATVSAVTGGVQVPSNVIWRPEATEVGGGNLASNADMTARVPLPSILFGPPVITWKVFASYAVEWVDLSDD